MARTERLPVTVSGISTRSRPPLAETISMLAAHLDNPKLFAYYFPRWAAWLPGQLISREGRRGQVTTRPASRTARASQARQARPGKISQGRTT
jgi:hypothetical protein